MKIKEHRGWYYVLMPSGIIQKFWASSRKQANDKAFRTLSPSEQEKLKKNK